MGLLRLGMYIHTEKDTERREIMKGQGCQAITRKTSREQDQLMIFTQRNATVQDCQRKATEALYRCIVTKTNLVAKKCQIQFALQTAEVQGYWRKATKVQDLLLLTEAQGCQDC